MKIAVFDCFSGISGDMTVGAFLDAGLPLSYLKQNLSRVKLKGYELAVRRVLRGVIEAAKFEVQIKRPGHRHVAYREIDQLIQSGRLKRTPKNYARKIFAKLAKAESKIHGIRTAQVHFHEVGAVDSIVDIVGAAIAVDYFGISRCFVSQLVDGCTVRRSVSHGAFPVPAPAVTELLKGFEITRTKTSRELITPTGAAIIAALCEQMDDTPLSHELDEVGYGAGDYEDPKYPNCLRISIGALRQGLKRDRVLLLETNIDDLAPNAFKLLYQRLFRAGALDVFLENILMKKMRPAFKLSVLMPIHLRKPLSEIIFRETPTLGVRYFESERDVLDRKIFRVKTEAGKIRMKAGLMDGKIIKIAPEYRDMKRLAERSGLR